MKTLSLIEKLVQQYAEDCCTEECENCSRYIGCAVLEAKNYLAEELGCDYEE